MESMQAGPIILPTFVMALSTIFGRSHPAKNTITPTKIARIFILQSSFFSWNCAALLILEIPIDHTTTVPIAMNALA